MAGKPNNKIPSVEGRKYGRYTVLRFSHHIFNKKGQKHGYFVVARCECGTEKILYMTSLQNKSIQSCGCLAKDKYAKEKSRIDLEYMFKRYKRESKANELSFELTPPEAFLMFQSPCFYCGMKDIKVRKGKEIKLNGIDRIDNSQGYSCNNCVPCCVSCNSLKGAKSLEDLTFRVLGIKERLPTIIAKLLPDHQTGA